MYIVARGTVLGDAGTTYKLNEAVPGKKGELADMEEAGSVRWVSPSEARRLRAQAAGGDEHDTGEGKSEDDAGDEGDEDEGGGEDDEDDEG